MVRDQREDPDWWNSLPPPIRWRFAEPAAPGAGAFGHSVATQVAEPPVAARFAWLRDSSILAVVFLAVAVANVAFLLLMLAFVDGTVSPVPRTSRPIPFPE